MSSFMDSLNPINANKKNGHGGKSRNAILGFNSAIFLVFLLFPLGMILKESFISAEGITANFFIDVWKQTQIGRAFVNSMAVSVAGALVSTIAAFAVAYSVHFTKLPGKLKKVISAAAALPMFLPTITYGFAIMYSFGNQGFWTKVLGGTLINIYGFNGLITGYFIYTFPVAFILISNGMKYLDKKHCLVSRLLKDKPLTTFKNTILIPLKSTIIISIMQCFFLSFTDFGIPTSIGGNEPLISKLLYEQMMGAVPDFGRGALIAIVMLLPSIMSLSVIKKMDKDVSDADMSDYEAVQDGKLRDTVSGIISFIPVIFIAAVFFVIFLIPFTESWPYQTAFTLDHAKRVFEDSSLLEVYKNSLITAFFTAAVGTAIAYFSALFTSRAGSKSRLGGLLNASAQIVNTVPGMVLGIAYLLAFSGTSFQNTLLLIVVCNIVHYFSTPYLMFRDTLGKLNQNWETTAKLLGDSWLKTVFRVITPNAKRTVAEVFSYYFINAMVTVSALIFIAGARSMVITVKIKELQYYGRFDDIFILSLLILITNLVMKSIVSIYLRKKSEEL